MTPGQAVKRVAKGAAWLDKKVPGWHRRVKLNKLNMERPCQCILGQVFEKDAKKEYGVSTHVSGWSFVFGRKELLTLARCERLGFDRRDDDSDKCWALLQDAWKDAIRERRV